MTLKMVGFITEYRMNGKKTRKSINLHRWYIVLQKRYYMYYIWIERSVQLK